jgi:hypothetical protein
MPDRNFEVAFCYCERSGGGTGTMVTVQRRGAVVDQLATQKRAEIRALHKNV